MIGQPAPGAAQEPAAGPSKAPPFTIAPYFGAATRSPVGTHLGVAPNRDHLFIGLHAVFNFVRRDRFALGYAPDVVPVMLLFGPEHDFYPWSDGETIGFYVPPGPAVGFGVSPLGVEAAFGLTRNWSAYGAGAAGVVWFNQEVPMYGARAFNYTFEFGGGLRRTVSRHAAIRVGYKFHHLSNAGTALFNPGVDGHVFLLGVERAFGE